MQADPDSAAEVFVRLLQKVAGNFPFQLPSREYRRRRPQLAPLYINWLLRKLFLEKFYRRNHIKPLAPAEIAPLAGRIALGTKTYCQGVKISLNQPLHNP